MKHIFLNITALVVCGFAVSANAQEANHLIISKELGTAPHVNAASVDLLGAQNLYKILGENYLVLAPNIPVNADSAITPSQTPLVVALPWIRPPIITICQCPASYVAALKKRFEHIDVETLLQPRTILPFDQGDAQ